MRFKIRLGTYHTKTFPLRMCFLQHVHVNFFLLQLQYGEPVIRRAVPLALAILSASNPQLSIIDTLSKLSHDNDAEVSHNSIFAMGIVGAGKSRTI